MYNWRDKEVLVAGGAGMIGSHLSRELIRRGAKVTIADNLSSGSLKNVKDMKDSAEIVVTDLRELRNCEKMTKGKDIVVQLAANMGGMLVISSKHAEIMRDSGLCNLQMLEASKRNAVPLYFFSSSACAYNIDKQTDPDNHGLKESDAFPGWPNEAYGWEKLYSEILCNSYTEDYDMNIRIARFHNVFGPAYTAFDDFKSKAPCRMIIDAIRRNTVEIWNDGKQTRSFLYIDDCVAGVLKLLESNWKMPLNIGSDRMVSMNEFAQLVIKITGENIKPTYYPDKPMGVRGRCSDNTLIKQVLGWEPKVSLEVGMQTTYDWAKRHLGELEGLSQI